MPVWLQENVVNVTTFQEHKQRAEDEVHGLIESINQQAISRELWIVSSFPFLFSQKNACHGLFYLSCFIAWKCFFPAFSLFHLPIYWDCLFTTWKLWNLDSFSSKWINWTCFSSWAHLLSCLYILKAPPYQWRCRWQKCRRDAEWERAMCFVLLWESFVPPSVLPLKLAECPTVDSRLLYCIYYTVYTIYVLFQASPRAWF